MQPSRARPIGDLVPDWSGGSFGSTELSGGNRVPLEVQAPVEPPPDNGGGRIGQGVRRDDVDDGTDDGVPVLLDGRQERLQPRLVDLTVAVQEDQHLPWTKDNTRATLQLMAFQKAGSPNSQFIPKP